MATILGYGAKSLKRVLITALGMNDPIHRKSFHTSASADARDREALRRELETALQDQRLFREKGYVDGPVASALSWWREPSESSEETRDLFPEAVVPWAPNELWLVYSDDSAPEQGLTSNEIHRRMELCRLHLPRLSGVEQLRVRGFPLKMEPYSYEMCWFSIESTLRPLVQPGWRPNDAVGNVTAEMSLVEPVDYRILVGPATQAIRTALFLLGLSTRDQSQLWYLVDAAAMKNRYHVDFPVVAKFRFGERGLPDLVEREDLERARSETVRYRDAHIVTGNLLDVDFSQVEAAYYRQILAAVLDQPRFREAVASGKLRGLKAPIYEAFADECRRMNMPRQTVHSLRDLFHKTQGILKMPWENESHESETQISVCGSNGGVTVSSGHVIDTPNHP